jgi:hypothetical protein
MQDMASTFKQMTEERYGHIRDKILFHAQGLYHNEVIANEISNGILVSLIDNNNVVDLTDSWVKVQVCKHSERYFTDLRSYCYYYALSLTKKPESAEDIAQISLSALLCSTKPVLFIKGWLKSTVYRQYLRYLKNKGRESDLLSSLEQNNGHLDNDVIYDENLLEKQLPADVIKRLLKKADYILYQKIKKFPNLRAYATDSNISYQSARERKHKVLYNLKANYLLYKGWKGSPSILSFRQMANIKRFTQTLVSHAINKDFRHLYHYCPSGRHQEIENILGSLHHVTDWGVQYIASTQYQIYLFDASQPSEPAMFTLDIAFNNANYLKIVHCAISPLIGIIPEDSIGELPLEHGMCPISMEQIQSMINK